MKELEIGEVDVINGKKVKCVKDENCCCDDCAFLDCDCTGILCNFCARKDENDVHFEEVD